jgi:hypothetical protein
MKKKTIQRIGVLIIASIFFMSTIAYILTGAINPPKTVEELTEFVIEGEISPETENLYLSRGYTSIKFYYSNEDLMFFIHNLPHYLKNSRDQFQMFIQKIPSNQTKAHIIGPYGETTLEEVTEDNLLASLCEIILEPPVECGYNQLNLTLETNSS